MKIPKKSAAPLTERKYSSKIIGTTNYEKSVSMIFIRQFGVILLVTFIGELLNHFIMLPIPASIYGLVIMLIVLKFGIIKLHHVKHTAEFLIEIMSLMFVPAAVGLVNSWGVLREILLPLVIITVVTTVFVMAVTGRVTQLVIRLERGEKK